MLTSYIVSFVKQINLQMSSNGRCQTRISKCNLTRGKNPDTVRSISFFVDTKRYLSPNCESQRKSHLKENFNSSLSRYSTKKGLKQAKKVFVHSLRQAMSISGLSRKNEIISTEGDSEQNFRGFTRENSKKRQKTREGRTLKKRENPTPLNLNVEDYMKIKSPSFIRPRRQTDKAVWIGARNPQNKKLQKNIGKGIEFRERKGRMKSMGSSFMDLEPWEVPQIREDFQAFQ